jgi:hypothetical protein
VLWVELRPEHDALSFLLLGFASIGVTVMARRRKVDEVANATSRFAAALPFLLAFILPWEATTDNALFVLGTSVFYAALGWVEHSRLFGTFGAVFANVALLVLALSQGFDSFEIYIVPLGIFTIITSHLFAETLPIDSRIALRFIGAALTYAPAGLALVFQVGNAQDDFYPLGFAIACLFGTVVGMLFHIRAYLTLGLGFLILDLATILIRASLLDQRLGFLVLSVTGLVILGVMVGYTLKKDQVLATLKKLRGALSTWD